MKGKMIKQTTALFLIYVLLAMTSPLTKAQYGGDLEPPKLPDLSKGRSVNSKGDDATDKLSPELKLLLKQYASGTKGSDRISMNFNSAQLNQIFGISNSNNSNPSVEIAVMTDGKTSVEKLQKTGMKVYMQEGDVFYGEVEILSLSDVAEQRFVSSIQAVKAAAVPRQPDKTLFGTTEIKPNSKDIERDLTKTLPLANEFNKAALTGKGVIVGVIDTGIDWQHPDFIRPDGTSRILAIWDMWDESFRQEKIGSAPPTLLEGGSPLYGTIYTNAQINAALKGKGTINTKDEMGHGTAVAGTAAGNPPRNTGNVPTAKYAGVAPEADLIIVRVSNCTGWRNYLYGAQWIIQESKKLKRPVVINQSFGGHYTAHDGMDSGEQWLNKMTGKNIPGVIFTVSAGNEGEANMHAFGRFGARRPGQEDVDGSPVITTILDQTELLGVFDARDDWGIKVFSRQSRMLDDDQEKIAFEIYKEKGELRFQYNEKLDEPVWFKRYAETVISSAELGVKNNRKTDWLWLTLPEGVYFVWGYGATERVVSGNYNFYLPDVWSGGFGNETVKTGMVGSPGNAANVITVGAYDFRPNWLNSIGSSTLFNFTPGNISDYSSPGGRRIDGVVKPDIASPATYTISPLSRDVTPAGCVDPQSKRPDNMLARPNVERYLTPDKKHLAWSGTSASSPYTAGVIALMLQKNPMLDAEQVRQIFIKTARKSGNVGAVPNPAWGYGMLDAAAAVQNTPAYRGKK